MRLFGLIFVLLFSFSYSQPLDWNYVNTGSNATIAISSSDFLNITFNNSPIPDGALIGVFYIDNNGDFVCGGFNTWDSSATISVTAWGTEAGLDNGFAVGETYNWFLQIEGQDYSPDSNGSTMSTTPPFLDTYSLNGFGQLTNVNFVGSIQGCTNPFACNFDFSATVDDGSCLVISNTCDICVNGLIVDNDSDNDGICDNDEVFGCTDSNYLEFDILATEDDGSCLSCINDSDGDSVCDEYEILGCTDSSEVNYDPLATEDDGSCGCLGGCTNPSAENYDPNACEDDGSCFFIVFGCTDSAALNYSSDATVDNGSCCYISGCTNPLYNEYNPSACIDDGSCLILPGCTDDGGFDGIPACNFNPDANLDNGTCEYNSCADDCGVPFGDNSTCNPIGCGDPQADNYDPNAAIVVIDPEYCEYVGCTDQNSFNYNPVANINDGSCCYLDGCTDPVASNYSVFACFNDGSCEYLYGCTDSDYVEYNPNATFDDGSCFTFIIYGCTDSSAGNYDDLATVDDGSCISSVQIDLIEVCNPICEDDLGAVVFELSGGVPPYSFLTNLNINFCGQMNGCGEFDCFSIDNQEYYIDDISPGFYSITVLDGIGYTFDVSFSILENNLIEPFIWEDGEGLSTYNNLEWTYQWFYMGQMLFSETNYEMVPQNGTGIYSVEVTDENGCVGFSQYQYETSHLSNNNEQHFYVFPNPSSDYIRIKSSFVIDNEISISIIDNLGKIVFEDLFTDLNDLEIKTKNLDSGLYFINILGNNNFNKRFSFIKTKN